MATLQKIRSHGVLLLVIVGAAMLAFILGDFLNSGSSFFNRKREYVGVIEKHKVHFTEFEAAKDQLTEIYKIETGRTDFDEDTYAQIRNQVWQMMVMDYTLQAQGVKIGMEVTPEELSELCIGENPHQIIRQRRAFYDESGQFSRDNLVRFLHSIDQEAETPEQAENLKQAKTYWLYWENATRLTYMQEKYTALLQNLVTSNPIDAKYQFLAEQTSVDIKYVAKPYAAMSDSLYNVKEMDIKRIYNNQKPLYKQTPNRGIEYMTFAVVPSAQDSADVKALMESIQEEFYTTDDVATVVNTNSDVMFDGRDYSINTIPEEYKDFAFGANAHQGDVTPLMLDGDTYRMLRLVKNGYSMPDSVELRTVVKEGEEEQPAQWYRLGELQANIATPAFAGKRGDQFTVAIGLGEVTLEITDIAKATPKVQLAVLERKITASSKTYSIIYNQAKQFVVNNNTEEMFRDGAAKLSLPLTPAYNLDKNQDKIADLKQSRPIVRWAYEANEGQISDVFECGDKFIVALLTDVNDADYRPFAELKPELTIQALNHMKAEDVAKQISGCKTLDEVAQKLGAHVETAEGLSMSYNRFGTYSFEPAVIGRALSAQAGEMTEAIEGKQAVFVLVAGEKHVAEGELDEKAKIQQMNSRYAYMLPYQATSYMQEKADITDNRANFQ